MSEGIRGTTWWTEGLPHPRLLLVFLLLVTAGLLSASACPAGLRYEIKVRTGDVFGGGTDSNIDLRLTGTRGSSAWHRLNDLIRGNAFERGDKNLCILKLSRDLGAIQRIEIRSDGRYAGSSWRLDEVTVEGGGAHAIFRFDRWVKEGTYRQTCVGYRPPPSEVGSRSEG